MDRGLIAITIMGIIVGSLGSALVVALKNFSAVGSRVSQSHDAQLLSSWLLPDVQSAGRGSSNADTNPSSAWSAVGCSGSPTVSPSTNVLTLKWFDYDDTTGASITSVSYRREGPTAPYALVRYFCANGGSPNRTIVGHNIWTASGSVTTNKIAIAVTSMVGTTTCPPPAPLPASDCYTFTASATRLTTTPPGNQAPAFTSQPTITGAVGSPFSFTITTSGSPTPVLTMSGALPGGVGFVDNNDGTATLSGTPGANTGGSYPIALAALNGVLPNGGQSFLLTVNQAPLFTSANSTTFVVGTAGSFTVTATGAPSPAVTESGALPSGVTFNPGTGSGTLTGTPAAVTAGTYTLTFTAASTTGTATQTFTLIVNQKPAITSANATTFTVGQAGTFTVTATGVPASVLSESGALPAGVTFTPATGILAGTPAAGTGKQYSITFTASNGVLPNATQTFTLTVNQAPAITSASSSTAWVGLNFSFTATATGFPAPTFSETGALPAGVTFSAAGVLSGKPAAGTAGPYPITITASNGVLPNATQTFTLTVNNSAPPTITSAINYTAAKNLAFNFTVTTAGAPTPALSRTGVLPNGVTFVDNGNGTATISGTPTNNGTFSLTITAANGVAPNAIQTFTLTVTNSSAAPAITSTNNLTVTRPAAVSFTVTTTGSPSPALSWSKVGAQTGPPAGVTFVNNGNGTATMSGTPTIAGIYTFTITAANGIGANATQTFTLTVI